MFCTKIVIKLVDNSYKYLTNVNYSRARRKAAKPNGKLQHQQTKHEQMMAPAKLSVRCAGGLVLTTSLVLTTITCCGCWGTDDGAPYPPPYP